MGMQHEMCVGLKKGKRVTPLQRKTKPSNMKGVSNRTMIYNGSFR